MMLRRRTVIARRLRRNATEVEQLFWRALGMSGFRWKFRRQHPIGRHIADFACPARKLAIELAGGQHAVAPQADNDRSAEMEAAGYRVIRFWNNGVLRTSMASSGLYVWRWRVPHLTLTLSAPRGGEGNERRLAMRCVNAVAPQAGRGGSARG